jgi:hypothetical protein
VIPVALLYFPTPHRRHFVSLEAPVSGMYFPAIQFSHVSSFVAPVDELNFPAGQASQIASLVAPVDTLVPNLPAPHATQSDVKNPRLGLKNPA